MSNYTQETLVNDQDSYKSRDIVPKTVIFKHAFSNKDSIKKLKKSTDALQKHRFIIHGNDHDCRNKWSRFLNKWERFLHKWLRFILNDQET